MDIPINAKVYCQDKLYGHTQAVVLNPVKDIITHVIVEENKSPHTKRLVPIDLIDASLTDNMHLKLNESMLQSLPPFFDVEYIQTTVPHYVEVSDMVYVEPVVVPEKKIIQEKIYHIPRDELAVNRGADVYSADGYTIGKVDEFLVDESGHHVTHLILRESHILGQKDVFIPVSEIESINETSLHLKLDRRSVERLPTIPVRRIWP
jgi:uncharacterized protein YrrD